MNTLDKNILCEWIKNPGATQRIIAELTHYSLGLINKTRKQLITEGFLSSENYPTEKTLKWCENSKPKNAIILAAGYGLRMIPANIEVPKGLLEIKDEKLIERLISQLHESGINDITLVVGFLKEKYEYLIEKFNVQLLVNSDYSATGNIVSLYKARHKFSNSYIIPCDVWCANNPFSNVELTSWYMASDKTDPFSEMRINRKLELISAKETDISNAMVGISYLLEPDAKLLLSNIEKTLNRRGGNKHFWEYGLINKNQMVIPAKVIPQNEYFEINTYEDLRNADDKSSGLHTESLNRAATALMVDEKEIIKIAALKKGMTNRSFCFECRGKKYIMRLPGEGTQQIINRKQEATVYKAIEPYNISDNVVFFDSENGYKLTEYIHNAHNCDPYNKDEVKICMEKLREFHNEKIIVEHNFNLFEQINKYEHFRGNAPSLYDDYKETKSNIFRLESYINSLSKDNTLCHIDAVPDNFLLHKNQDGKTVITLIDWEYAAMQDPHVDIAMFAIYSMYTREKVEDLIDAYFTEGCPAQVRTKIYCYIAICGMLWSNWCEYKHLLGIEFGEYSLMQYRYAKEYYKIAASRIEKEGGKFDGNC